MKLSELENAVKAARKFCNENGIEDPDCVVDMDENGYYSAESLEADTTEDGDIVINIKSSNEA